MDLTPETIEALDCEDIPTIQAAAKALHEATPHVLTFQSSVDASDEEDKRNMMRLKLDECMWSLSAKIADLDALKKELRIMKGYQSADQERVRSLKFQLLLQEKKLRDESRSPRPQ